MSSKLTEIRAASRRILERIRTYETHHQRIIDLIDAVEHGMMQESEAMDEIGQRLDALEGKYS